MADIHGLRQQIFANATAIFSTEPATSKLEILLFARNLDHTSSSPRTYVALLVSIPQDNNAEPKPLLKARSAPSADMALLVLLDKLALRATEFEETCKLLGNDV